MTKKVQNQEEVFVAETVSKAEKFFENNGKKVLAGLVAVLVVVAAVFFFKSNSDKNELAALEAIYGAQEYLKGETANYELALNGDGVNAGFLDVIEQYGSTKAGNIANHCAGICYLHLGDLENAEKYLKAYDAVEDSAWAEIIDAQNLGLLGDIAVEKGNYAEAAELFEEAVEASENGYTAPHYLYKKALVHAALNETAEAQECYKTISEKYPNSVEAREAIKMLF